MTIRKLVLASVLSTLLVAGGAAAQTVAGGVTSSTSPITTSVNPGTGVNMGTIMLTGVNGGGTVTSLPITITPSNGGAVGNLSNCQVFSSSGTSLTTGSNVVNTVGTGANTFTLNSPFTLSGTGATSSLTVRCDVAQGTASGSMFTISAGTPVLGSTLWVNLDTAPSVPAGSQDVALANISLGAAAATYNVSSIPLTITAGNGGSTANLSGCVVRNSNSLDGALTATPVINNGSATSFALAIPLTVFAGTAPMLSLTCDLQPATPVGSTYTISINPSTVAATNAATGATVTPSAVVGIGPNNLPASTSGTVIVSAQGTAPVPPPSSDDGTPGVPNTGTGSTMAMILALLGVAGIVAISGSMYLRRS